jgi:hypothetical protein
VRRWPSRRRGSTHDFRAALARGGLRFQRDAAGALAEEASIATSVEQADRIPFASSPTRRGSRAPAAARSARRADRQRAIGLAAAQRFGCLITDNVPPML